MTIADKIRKYCCYQDRCIQDVRMKIASFKLSETEAEKLLQQMMEEDFVNEERYVESYIRGKINIKKWGRVKIKNELLQKRIALSLINEKLENIDEGQYIENLVSTIRKWKLSNGEDEKEKLYRHLLMKGYEPNFIIHYINK